EGLVGRTIVGSSIVVPLLALVAVFALTSTGFAEGSATAASADLQLGLNRLPGSISVGDRLTYVFHVRNKGPAQATSVVLLDEIAAQVVLVSAKASQGRCSGSAAIRCSLGLLKAGRTAAVTLVAEAKAEGRAVNRVSV